MDEILARSRRIETRLTALMVAQGITTEHQRPVFDAGPVGQSDAALHLPSPHTSIKEVLAAIPDGFDESFALYVGDSLVGRIRAC